VTPAEARPSPSVRNQISPFQTLILVCLVATLCYLAAKLAVALAVRSQMVWPLWPGCALLVAVLLLVQRRIWPILITAGFAGFILYDLQAGVTIRSTALLILADTIEVLIAALGVSYSFDHMPRLNSVKSLAKYSLFAVILAPASAAFVGAAALGGAYWIGWRISFFTEALAFLTVTPAILSWFSGDAARAQKSRAYYFEAAVLIAGLFLLAYITLVGSGGKIQPAMLYSFIPFLLWSALRFGSIGISTSMIVVVSLSIWGAVDLRGPFAGPDPLNNVLSLQLFLLVTAMPFMVLAALVEERTLADTALRESEQRFRLVANTAPVLIWMSGPDKLCNYFNASWIEFTGRPIEAELGNGWVEGVHSEDLKSCLDTYTRAFDRRAPFQMHYRLRRRDGEYRWVIDVGVPRLAADGSLAGFIGSCTDVTEQMAAQDALERLSAKLLDAQEKERNRIARELHDDICQKLAMLSVEIEQSMTMPAGTPEQTNCLQEVWEQCSKITGDVQALSRGLHSSLMLDHLGLIAVMKSFCSKFSEQQRVVVEFTYTDVPTPLPRDVSVCLFRVAQEALHNAVKHSGVQYFKAELRGTSEEIQLTVSDSGVGFHLEAATMSQGLGLVSMRERVHSVKGKISIESQPDHGTTIRARVPLRWGDAALGLAG
jgi:PAS domain S-box-containing protein